MHLGAIPVLRRRDRAISYGKAKYAQLQMVKTLENPKAADSKQSCSSFHCKDTKHPPCMSALLLAQCTYVFSLLKTVWKARSHSVTLELGRWMVKNSKARQRGLQE